MNGNNFLVDTNVVLYLLAGDQTLASLLDQKNLYISFITELELLGYKNYSDTEAAHLQAFIQSVQIIDINNAIKQGVIDFRKHHKIKLPDAIIAATAFYLDLPLLTADSDFRAIRKYNDCILREIKRPKSP